MLLKMRIFQFIKRAIIFIGRFWIGLKIGILFRGTTHFEIPSKFKIHRKWVSYVTPCDLGNASDFINLVLDDEYGLRVIPESPRTILDIGANCGLFSLMASHQFPEAMIHAYEPNPRVFEFAVRNFESTLVQVFCLGVGAKEGRAQMTENSDSTLVQTVFGGEGSIVIQSLDQALAQFPGHSIDLLKMDCEGAEWEIFKNPAPFKKIKRIRMEYHLIEGRTVEDFIQQVTLLDYRIERLIKNQGFGLAWLVRKGG